MLETFSWKGCRTSSTAKLDFVIQRRGCARVYDFHKKEASLTIHAEEKLFVLLNV